MNEYETDPRRPPADAEQSHYTAELPRTDRGPLDSPAGSRPSGDGPGAPAGPYPPSPWQAPPTSAGYPGQPAPSAGYPGQPATSVGYSGQPASPGAYPGPYAAAGGYPGQLGSPVGYPGQPTAPGYPGQPTAPGYPGQPTAPGYPGQHTGGPSPLWHQPGTAGEPARQPARVGRAMALGAAALVLMVGSGIAGGAVALALDDSGSTGGRTFTAAPIISEADLPGIAASVKNSVVSVSTGGGEGSGVVMSADGLVLTNNHVVSGAGETVRVVFANGKIATAKIVGTDPKTDLAVLKAEGASDLAAATFGDSDAMRVGDTVLALGSPLGLQGSVTAGIISSLDRTIRAGGNQGDPQQGASSISGLLQTDAPINPGNSGGALVNTRGEVIGINTAIATAGQSNGNIGVGFAIPSNKAKAVAEALRRGEKVSHPYLGVAVTPSEDGGAVVGNVTPDSPAARAGLQQGDVVTRFGDKVIKDSNDLVAAVQAGKVGDQVELRYTRNGIEKTATVTLAETS